MIEDDEDFAGQLDALDGTGYAGAGTTQTAQELEESPLAFSESGNQNEWVPSYSEYGAMPLAEMYGEAAEGAFGRYLKVGQGRQGPHTRGKTKGQFRARTLGGLGLDEGGARA
ncbi:MAG: hypothetical protein WBX25_11150 [Rhodomicrobium sp.]